MKLTCPVGSCRADNEWTADCCARCGASLRGYAKLSARPARLFNQGLAAARSGQLGRARDLFASIVYWCPMDKEARNALAMACYGLGDKEEAMIQWRTVLARLPADAIATRGIAALESAAAQDQTNVAAHTARPRSKKKRGGPHGRR